MARTMHGYSEAANARKKARNGNSNSGVCLGGGNNGCASRNAQRRVFRDLHESVDGSESVPSTTTRNVIGEPEFEPPSASLALCCWRQGRVPTTKNVIGEPEFEPPRRQGRQGGFGFLHSPSRSAFHSEIGFASLVVFRAASCRRALTQNLFLVLAALATLAVLPSGIPGRHPRAANSRPIYFEFLRALAASI